ncbi:MAG: hypothetical protein JSC188_000402 [Candidatus Tokpelaia sp. JSC188]|nr:MAG: hypothetical protein JSC188_000402 [Candidatus Tokpelaia sp. JSC188]
MALHNPQEIRNIYTEKLYGVLVRNAYLSIRTSAIYYIV